MQFYQKLSELRKSAGLSQEELATKVGVSRQTVFKWESGLSSPSMDNILVLCRLFSVSADELIGNTPPKETKEEIQAVPVFSVYRFRYEYKSKRTLWGLPLVHIHIGFGFCKAKGIIAIGNIACGLISVGGLALGLLSIGRLCLGTFSPRGGCGWRIRGRRIGTGRFCRRRFSRRIHRRGRSGDRSIFLGRSGHSSQHCREFGKRLCACAAGRFGRRSVGKLYSSRFRFRGIVAGG